MPKRPSTTIRARDLLGVALTAGMEILAFSHARADAEYFAPASPPSQDRGYPADWPFQIELSCGDAIFDFGDQHCGPMTNGPSGSSSDRGNPSSSRRRK